MNMSNWQWYVSQFPESMFLCSQEKSPQYSSNIINGKAIASHSSVLICGIIRNAERCLPYTMARIQATCNLFKSSHVYIFENDSIDKTLSILKVWAANNPNITIGHDTFNAPPFDDPRGQVRRFYMAKARNRYLDFARTFTTSNKTDFVIIVDMDLAGGWSYHGLLNTIGQNIYWDVVGSNSLYYTNRDNEWFKLFYDSWAFRAYGQPEALSDHDANLFIFNRGEAMVPVNSCFGGLAIYKPHFLFKNLNYTAEDCDHPSLHNELIKLGYSIFINPSQITLYNKSQYVV